MSNTTNHVSRASRVSDVVTASFAAVSTKDQDRRDAKDVLTVATDDAVNTREGQLVTLANISARERWELIDIESGVDAALKTRNGKDTAINTFAGEIKRACHPNACNYVSSMQELAQNVWDAELATEDKSAPRPLRTAFARRYHMLQRMISQCIDAKRPLETPAEVAEWAISLDPAKDPSKAFKRRTALLAQIRAMSDEFPHIEQLRACCEKLNTLTIGDFKNEQPKSVIKQTSVRKSPSAPETIDAIEEITPAMGVSDLLDEALRDIEAA